MSLLSELFGSKSRAELFRLLFELPGKELYLREIQRQSGLSLRPIQEELIKLKKMELLETRKDGNRVYFRANTKHPLFPEIRNLVEKTVGFLAVLHESLVRDKQIRSAFIFGSIAKGTARSESDLDLFIIGDLGLRKVTGLLSGVSDKLGRVINPHVMPPEELAEKIAQENHFILNVMESKKLFVIGNEDELRRMGKKRLVKTP